MLDATTLIAAAQPGFALAGERPESPCSAMHFIGVADALTSRVLRLATGATSADSRRHPGDGDAGQIGVGAAVRDRLREGQSDFPLDDPRAAYDRSRHRVTTSRTPSWRSGATTTPALYDLAVA